MKCNPIIDVANVESAEIRLGVFTTFNARSQVFDFSAWAARLGSGEFSVSLLRPGDAAPYRVADVEIEGTTARWTFDATDTAVSGYGKAFLTYAGDGFMDMTVDIPVYVAENSSPAGDAPPEPLENWYRRMLEAEAQAQSAAQTAQGASESAQDAASAAEASLDKQPYPNAVTGTWWRWNSAAGVYEDTGEPYALPASTYVHSQNSASAEWTIEHDLAKFPSVTVVDSAGTVVVGDVFYVSENVLTVSFAAPFSGTAYLN